MRVTVTFEVNAKTAKLISECSLERVINTSMGLIEGIEGITEDDAKADRVDTNIQDWKDCKLVASTLWNALRDGVFRYKNNKEQQFRDWIV